MFNLEERPTHTTTTLRVTTVTVVFTARFLLCVKTVNLKSPPKQALTLEVCFVQADVYSFGMLVYEVATGGRHPYHDMRSRAELDEATLRALPVQPLSAHRVPPWPDLEDVILHCLRPAPEKRPTVRLRAVQTRDPR